MIESLTPDMLSVCVSTRPHSCQPTHSDKAGWDLFDVSLARMNSICQIQQYSIGIGDGVLAELATFQVFLPHLAVAANGDFP